MNDLSLTRVQHDPFAGPGLAAFFPLSESQREVWLAASMEREANLSYNEGIGITLRGPLEVTALRNALKEVIERHEALHASISPDGRSLCVHSSVNFDLPVYDLRDGDIEQNRRRHEAEEMKLGFDLERGPLVRLRLLKAADDLHYLLWVAHHVVCDGWSTAVLLTEIARLYSAQVEGGEVRLPPAPRDGDYVMRERRFYDSPEGQDHARYWIELLKNPPSPVSLPADRARPLRRDYAADRYDYRIDEALTKRLRDLGASRGASLVATLLAAFTSAMHRWSGCDDLVIGLAAAGQSFSDQPKLVGHCVNLLPLRLKPDASAPFATFLKTVRGLVLDAFEHQGVTFGTLLPKLKIQRDESRPPLVSVVFNVDIRDDDIRHAGLQVDYSTLVRVADNFELYINVVDTGRDLILECQYATSLYDERSIIRRMREFEVLLRGVCDEPETVIGRLPLLTVEESYRLLPPPKMNFSLPATSLDAGFFAQAKRTPGAVALSFEDQSLTYQDLAERVERWARRLSAAGASRNTRVALFLNRSLESVIAILATLRAGAAYVPIDPMYPAERIRFMLQDAKPVAVLTHSALAERLSEAAMPVWVVDQPAFDHLAERAVESGPARTDDVAYIIYTSGSTGVPKGCLVTHRNVLRLFSATQDWFQFGSDDVWTLFHSYAFDFSVWELWGPLLYGGRLVVVPYWTSRDPERFHMLLASEGVTVLNQTPSAFRTLIDADGIEPRELALRYVIFGGEALDFTSLVPWFERHGDEHPRLINMYGITETTVHVTYRPVTTVDVEAAQASLIGEPIPDLAIHLLDPLGQAVPVGVPGEIYVVGAGVAGGYLNRDELTAQRFTEDPVHAQLRRYRAGDLARRLENGDLEYLGRIDSQVKIRGFRIELGEIEARLAEHPSVAQCVVIARTGGGAGSERLDAYVVPNAGQGLEPAMLREHLRRSLPDYMVPQSFVSLAALPLTGNGKLDRAALPDPPSAARTQSVKSTPPKTEMERTIGGIWREVLHIEHVGREDRLFDLGGDSLKAVEVAARLRKITGARLPLRAYMMDTLAQLSATLAPSPTPNESVESSGEGPAPRGVAMQPLYFGDRSRSLFGVYYPPQEAPRKTAILICQSWGMEYLRAYRGLRQFAILLARAGFPVLRFDYYGTGDSMGSGLDSSVEGWLKDIETAAAVLRQRSGASVVGLFGLRLGGLLAAAAKNRGGIGDRLILWDAPESGSSYAKLLREFDRHSNTRKNRVRTAASRLPPPEADELLGHAWPAAVDQGLAKLSLAPLPSVDTLVAYSADSPLPDLPANMRVLGLPDRSFWSNVNRFASPWIPTPSLIRLTETLSEWLP